MRILRLAMSLGSKVSSVVMEYFWNTQPALWNDLDENWNE